MLSEKLTKALEENPYLKARVVQVQDKFSKRVMRLGQGEPLITRETMYLMAVEIQMVFRHFGYDARVIMKKQGDGASITLTSPEEQRGIFKKKEDNEESSNTE
jgi:hypothetical protein